MTARHRGWTNEVRADVRKTGKAVEMERVIGDAPDGETNGTAEIWAMRYDMGSGKFQPVGFAGLFGVSFDRQLRLPVGICEPLRIGYYIAREQEEAEAYVAAKEAEGYRIILKTWELPKTLPKRVDNDSAPA